MWSGLNKQQIGRVITGLKVAGIAVGGILGFKLGKAVFGVGAVWLVLLKHPLLLLKLLEEG